MKDFTRATFTAICSDLHLCEEEPVHPLYPLWKKYKTKQFFFDDEFKKFLNYLDQEAGGDTVELILNGDIFDFDSVTSLPEQPSFHVSWVESRRGLSPQEEKSEFKIEKILMDHKPWTDALREFILKGHRAIFIIGNHDVELYFPRVQQKIHEIMDLPDDKKENLRFCEWFYISNGDTLIEHGHQYDPYCLTSDPINPFVLGEHRLEVRVPFGNLATRYLVNGMGFFNPHLDTNFIMTPKEYVIFFWKYMIKAQPFIMFSWLWGSTAALFVSVRDHFRRSISDPLTIEDRIEDIAKKSNVKPRVVRELKELSVDPATTNPFIIARELWLDRAFIVLIAILGLYLIFLQVDALIDISMLWILVPLLLFLPFFIFYSRSIRSVVREFKEPQERILSLSGLIANVSRVIYGHTHIVRHEVIGAIEHLNSGTWSPAFLDVECEKPIGQKTFVLIQPNEEGGRDAQVFQIKKGQVHPVFATSGGRADREKLEEKQAVKEKA